VYVSDLTHKCFIQAVASCKSSCRALGIPTGVVPNAGDVGYLALRMLGFYPDPDGGREPLLAESSLLGQMQALREQRQQQQHLYDQLHTQAQGVQAQNQRVAAELAELRSQTQAQVSQLQAQLLQSQQQQHTEAQQHNLFFEQVEANLASKAAEQAAAQMRIHQVRAAAHARARPALCRGP